MRKNFIKGTLGFIAVFLLAGVIGCHSCGDGKPQPSEEAVPTPEVIQPEVSPETPVVPEVPVVQ